MLPNRCPTKECRRGPGLQSALDQIGQHARDPRADSTRSSSSPAVRPANRGIFPLRQIFLHAALSSWLRKPPDSAAYARELEASNDLLKADYRRVVEGLV